MKSTTFILLIIVIIIKYSKEEIDNESSSDFTKEEDNKNNSISRNEENKSFIDNIYLMDSSKEFDLNIKINGTKENTLIILFFSPNCIHCKHFLPIYKEISEALINNTNLKFSKIQFSSSEKILKKYTQIKIPGVPKLYFYKRGNFIPYEGKRDKEEIITFINRIHKFECTQISTTELNKFINYKTIFSLDKENQFILGLFKNRSNSINSFIANNFFELNSLNNDLLLNKKCFYHFYNDKEENITENNYYLSNIILNKNIKNDNENKDYLIYSYNYHKGLNTFSLFHTYLNFQNNSTEINDNKNLNKHIKIIQNKYKDFIDNNYLYNYYYINDTQDLSFLNHLNKKYFLFNYRNESLHKFFINEINYILSLNNSLNKDYLFILFNINYAKSREREGISFYDPDNLSPKEIINKNKLNRTHILNVIFDYIYKDQNHLIKSHFEESKKLITDTFNTVFNWFLELTSENKTNTSNLGDLNKIKEVEDKKNSNDIEQELIDEINKTIIEDNNKNKEKEKEKKNKNKNSNIKNLKRRRKKILEFTEDEDFGFNKNLLLLPLYLIIYSILYYLFYRIVLMKFQGNISYKKLATDENKRI